jgi:hypothetical protein
MMLKHKVRARRVAVCLVGAALLFASARAQADVTLTKAVDPKGGGLGGWELFSNGRINAFFSYTNGDGFPLDKEGRLIRGGGATGNARREPLPGTMTGELTQGTMESMRVRSGFLGNIIGVGMRRNVTEYTRVVGYLSIWAQVESEDRRKYLPVTADVREGYARLEGPWGSFLAGRSLALFSRGATDIDFLYGHGWSLGFPGAIDFKGPAAGHIGFGVLGNGFAAGFVYATPVLGGFQLTTGLYDPSSLVGSKLERTGLARPEAELTFERAFTARSKLVLFVNGAWQKLYERNGTFETSAYGMGYGGRLEIGPVHFGAAGHRGVGLGLNYALEPSAATYTDSSELRHSDGYYGQLQVVLGKVDLSAGWGATRIHTLPIDWVPEASTGAPKYSIIRQQVGASLGVTYHAADYLHFAADYFRAYFDWWLGEKQVVHFVSVGTTVTW